MAKVKKDEYFVIHTDGSCKDGIGGWSYTIKTKKAYLRWQWLCRKHIKYANGVNSHN